MVEQWVLQRKLGSRWHQVGRKPNEFVLHSMRHKAESDVGAAESKQPRQRKRGRWWYQFNPVQAGEFNDQSV